MEFDFEKHCWAEIDLDALRGNYKYIKNHAGDTQVCCVVKSDAYGHGDLPVVRELLRMGVKWFAVSCLQEALRLRRNGVNEEIIILGYTSPEQAPVLAQNRIIQALFTADYARALSQAWQACGQNQPVRCHLKVDTGMGRIGFDVRNNMEAAAAEMSECFQLPGLEITGLFQHFAVADDLKEDSVSYTERQHDLFVRTLKLLQQKGHNIKTAHCCNSAGQLMHTEWHLDLVRAGIILYGEPPSDDVIDEHLTPLLTLKTVISQVKQLEPGACVSYGRTYRADKPVRVATLCCGYADGYPRLLSNKGVVSIHGKPAAVVGRVCMDQMLVDVTDIPEACAGDEVCVFGGRGCQDSAVQAAAKAGTINYELLCGISRRVPRVYISEGKIVHLLDRMNGE